MTKGRKEAPAKPDLGDEDGVHRLTDMDTREVSVVDQAANKRTFLMVKRDAKTTTKEDPVGAETKTEKKDEVKKMRPAGSIEDALQRVGTLKLAMEAAPVAQSPGSLPAAFGTEIRYLQFFLKGLTQKGNGARLYLGYCTGDDVTKASLQPMSADVKKGALATLTEVETRLSKLYGDLEKVSMFDPSQTKAIEGAADLLGKIVSDYPTGTTKAVIVMGSMPESVRAPIVAAIEKAMGEMSEVYMGLMTPVAKDGAADTYGVAIMLDDAVASLDASVGALFTPDVLDINKAIAAARALRKGDKKAEAERATTIGLIQKALNIQPQETNVATTTTPPPAPSTTTEKKDEKPAPAADDVSKVGRPMAQARLDRMKAALQVLKEALADLKGGTAPIDKFKKAAGAFNDLVRELDIQKGINARMGITDERSGTNPDAPNLGSGVQPDSDVTTAAEGLTGEGTPDLGEILKDIRGLREENEKLRSQVTEQSAKLAKSTKDQEATLAALREEAAVLRKRRVAPSTIPDDGEGSSPSASAEGDVHWPYDMAAAV